jgi:hypothetical protein
MEKLILAAPSQVSPVRSPAAPRVYIDGARRRDLHVLTWEVLGPPLFGRAVLTVQPTAPGAAPARIEERGSLPEIGSAVLIQPADESAGEDFRGAVSAHRLEIGPEGERLVVEAEHQLAGELSATIADRRQLTDGQALQIDEATVRFNAPDGLASAQAVAIGSREARVFDTSTEARPWTVADALGYLLATTAAPDVECPGLEELGELAGGTDLGVLDVTGLSAAEAMTRAAARGGLALRAAAGGKGLVFYRPGFDGRCGAVSLQRAGEKLSTQFSNLWRGWVSIRPRPSHRAVLALGDYKRYESTFQARPGWDTSLQTSRWRDFVRSESSDWPLLGDVYRKWVLNEHGWYSQAPWNLPVHDFSPVSGSDFALAGPRALLPCLSADRAGASLGIVVEYRCDGSASWRRWRGPLWVSRDEAAVYLGGDALGAEYFQAAVAGTVQVRITASLAADARLTAMVEGSQAYPRTVLEAAQRAKWSAVDAGSVFFGRAGLGAPSVRDDSAMLQELAETASQVASSAVEAELTLGWVDTSHHVGDRIERIAGRGVELPSRGDAQCHIRSVRHDFGSQQTTTLHITG